MSRRSGSEKFNRSTATLIVINSTSNYCVLIIFLSIEEPQIKFLFNNYNLPKNIQFYASGKEHKA